MKIGEVEVGRTAKTVFSEFREDDLQGLAAEVAYHLLFSIVPLLIFLTALSGFIGRGYGPANVIGNITGWLQSNTSLPPATVDTVLEPIQRVLTEQAGGFLSVGAVLALWSGKNAIASLMKALNVAFDVKETRAWWKKTAIAIGLTVALGLAIIVSAAAFVAGSAIGDTVFGWLGVGSTWAMVWALLRWPLILALLVLALAFFYWAGPNISAPFKWLSPGSVLTVLLWGLASWGLGFYFARFAGYVDAYGALGGVLAFVFWLYVMSLILLLGGELNSVLARHYSPETQAQVADPEKAINEDGTKRRAAAGSEPAPKSAAAGQRTVHPPTAPPMAPLPPMPAFRSVAAGLPSAEGAARSALAAEGGGERERRFRSAVVALGVSAAAAVSAALVGAGRRSS